MMFSLDITKPGATTTKYFSVHLMTLKSWWRNFKFGRLQELIHHILEIYSLETRVQ